MLRVDNSAPLTWPGGAACSREGARRGCHRICWNGKATSFGDRGTRVPIQALLFTRCLTLGELLTLPKLQWFPSMQQGRAEDKCQAQHLACHRSFWFFPPFRLPPFPVGLQETAVSQSTTKMRTVTQCSVSVRLWAEDFMCLVLFNVALRWLPWTSSFDGRENQSTQRKWNDSVQVTRLPLAMVCWDETLEGHAGAAEEQGGRKGHGEV